MSAISGFGRVHHPAHARPSAGISTSLTSSTLSGSITGSNQVVGQFQSGPSLSPGVMKKIEQAVTSALQSSKPTDDPKKLIRNAITSVLKNGSIEPDDDSAVDTTDSDGIHRTFNQTLQAYGVSPQQFSAQLAAALHRPGSSNTSSFPPGIVLDTSA